MMTKNKQMFFVIETDEKLVLCHNALIQCAVKSFKYRENYCNKSYICLCFSIMNNFNVLPKCKKIIKSLATRFTFAYLSIEKSK